MYKPQRLHPVAIIDLIMRNIYRFVQAMLPLFVLVFSSATARRWLMLTAPVLVLVILTYVILYWYRYVFYIQDQELRLEYGVLVRKKRYIPFERIQTVQISAGIIQRIFGLVKLQVETAGGGKQAEVVLAALQGDKAAELRGILQTRNTETAVSSVEEGDTLQEHHLSKRLLLLLASTSNGIGVVLSFLLLIISQLHDFFPQLIVWTKVQGAAENVIAGRISIIVIAILLLFLMAWTLSLVGTIITYGNFVLVREGNNIKISKGLIERKQLTIPVKRIQAIKVVESILRQPFGLVSLQMVSISNTGERGEGNILFPLLPRSKVLVFLQNVIPEFSMPLEVESLPARSRRYYIVPALIVSIIIASLTTALLPWGYIAWGLVIMVLFLSNRQFIDAGWQLRDDKLMLRTRSLGLISTIIPGRRIQSLDLSRNYFQAKRKVNTINLSVASGTISADVKLKGMDDEKSQFIIEWFSSRSDMRH